MQLERIIQTLSAAGIPSPRLEVRLIAASGKPAEKIEEIVQKRIAGWPLDKLLGAKPFYKYQFITNESVLSPRPETEILVEKAVEFIKERHCEEQRDEAIPSKLSLRAERSNPSPSSREDKDGLLRQAFSLPRNDESVGSILDLGTGSGCILLSILKEFPCLEGVGADKSSEALSVARQNAAALGVENARFIEWDWFDSSSPFQGEAGRGHFDLILSNPPYIPTKDIEALGEEVKGHDPLLALDGGADGLAGYRKIAELAPRLLNPGGHILLEIGIGQETQVRELFAAAGLNHLETLPDLAGIPRCLVFSYSSPSSCHSRS